MKKTIIALTLVIFTSLIAQDSKTIKETKEDLNFIKALKSKNTKFFENSFAPNAFSQYVVKSNKFSETDYKDFVNKKGILYDLFFNSNFVKENFNKNSVSFSEAFSNSFGISIHASSDDRYVLSSISTVYNGLCYDIILNCNDDANICEISGLNISGCKGLDDIILSKLPKEEIKLQQLTERKYLKESREWVSSGIQILEVFDEKRKAIFGPNLSFNSVFTGVEDGYGGVAYLRVKTKNEANFFLFYRHLTSINSKLANGNSDLEPGTFIGSNEKKIGIQSIDEPAKLTIDGRTSSGNPITTKLTIQILKGAL
ncbi:hypothetical protein [Leptospira harrisiae]|uniref:hypothetical protein n=1 Tax=Leptospira harrisiae TaxID=2023189 RepID=UPI000C2A3A86|nr:hypothetical protein [Leptospira harrisiae]PKA06483.1 hypothetical protein CH366_18940 [Leptospira harrisiae]